MFTPLTSAGSSHTTLSVVQCSNLWCYTDHQQWVYYGFPTSERLALVSFCLEQYLPFLFSSFYTVKLLILFISVQMVFAQRFPHEACLTSFITHHSSSFLMLLSTHCLSPLPGCKLLEGLDHLFTEITTEPGTCRLSLLGIAFEAQTGRQTS